MTRRCSMHSGVRTSHAKHQRACARACDERQLARSAASRMLSNFFFREHFGSLFWYCAVSSLLNINLALLSCSSQQQGGLVVRAPFNAIVCCTSTWRYVFLSEVWQHCCIGGSACPVLRSCIQRRLAMLCASAFSCNFGCSARAAEHALLNDANASSHCS